MEIILRARSRRIKQKVERDHQWYDHHTKTMLSGRGGEMRFRYEGGRQVPYIVDHEDWVWKNDYDEIVDWVSKNKEKIQITDQARGHFILIDVDKSDVDDITYDLNLHGIMFDL